MLKKELNEGLKIADKTFSSRLMVGTGKFDDFETMKEAHKASGAEIVTVAIRRVDESFQGHVGLMDNIDLDKYWILPNTAGCATAEEALRVARLSRAMGINNWIKLEVIPDAKYLLPDPVATYECAKILIDEGFIVLPYINADPVLAKKLEEIGCATVMPLASPIGTGQGVKTLENIKIIIEQANVPVVIDAGIGTPSDAALLMESGADFCMINTAIAKADDPVKMASAFKHGIIAGREAFEAGRIPVKQYASASSPLAGVIGS